ncbi:Hint domain-containing protein [Acetobacter persici]|uniref:Hint domain-containing protein n=1 Tax=Acetobacter persici TaxID=1076596 RepID=UPI001BA75EE1|nr:Hint domain-containing protein [Acetobacter persici]MBS1000321.1 Hint domain-containing protein [Acetobacter persici]
MTSSALTASSLTWQTVIENGDNSHDTVTLDSSGNAVTVSGTVQGDWGNADNAINALVITGTHPVTLSGTGTLLVHGTVTANNHTIIDGMTTNVQSSVSGGTITIQGGGTLIAQSVSSNIVFGQTTSGTSNTLQLNTSSASLTSVANLSPGDVIDFVGNTWDLPVSWQKKSEGTYTLLGKTGDTLIASVTFAKKSDGTSYIPADFHAANTTVLYSGNPSQALTLESDESSYAPDNSGKVPDSGSSSQSFSLACFLPDSMIETPAGDIAVEMLRRGDHLIAYVDGSPITRSIVWTGYQHVTVQPGLPDDEAGYPVRILKDAISDGVPYKDMLITPEHCLFFGAAFIPVRMLVNGRSIFYDRTISSYTYYHVETAEHSIIRADGVLTESYLDTGNRNSFVQDSKVVAIHAGVTCKEKEVSLSRTVDRQTAEVCFNLLRVRAETAGVPYKVNDVPLTDDVDLRLVTSKGQVIRSLRVLQDTHVFMIPPGVDSVKILTRTSRPCDVEGPFVDDRRHLGILVGSITFQGMKTTVPITDHLSADTTEGWSVQEQLPCRWTTGNAYLPLPLSTHCGILSIQVLASRQYEDVAKTSCGLSIRSA